MYYANTFNRRPIKDKDIDGNFSAVQKEFTKAQVAINDIEETLRGYPWGKVIIDKDLTAPPATPAKYDRYIVAGVATGEWAGQENKIAWFDGNFWKFTMPSLGMTVFVADEMKLYTFTILWVLTSTL